MTTNLATFNLKKITLRLKIFKCHPLHIFLEFFSLHTQTHKKYFIT